MNAETPIMAAIRKAVNCDGRARLVRNNVGFDAEKKVRYGLGVGSADLVGFLLDGSARLFCIEVKTPTGRLSPEQRAWIGAVRRNHGFAAVARSVPEAMAALERALAGACE